MHRHMSTHRCTQGEKETHIRTVTHPQKASGETHTQPREQPHKQMQGKCSMHDLFTLICMKIGSMINKQVLSQYMFKFKCASSAMAQLGSFFTETAFDFFLMHDTPEREALPS